MIFSVMLGRAAQCADGGRGLVIVSAVCLLEVVPSRAKEEGDIQGGTGNTQGTSGSLNITLSATWFIFCTSSAPFFFAGGRIPAGWVGIWPSGAESRKRMKALDGETLWRSICTGAGFWRTV